MLPITLKSVIAALVFEAAGLVTLGSFAVAAATSGQAFSFGAGITEGVIAFGLAAALASFAWALSKRRSGVRNATIYLQIMLTVCGGYMIQAGVWWAGLPAVVLGVASIGVLISSPVREALGIR